MEVDIRRLGAADERAALAAEALFDGPADAEATRRFLAAPGHHLLVAYDGAGRPVGFVSGVELTHPDKGTELFLYELGVEALARERGCHGMYTLADEGNAAARAAYRSAGGREASRPVMIDWDLHG